MARAINTAIKRAILRLLQRRGYLLIRQTDYAKLLAGVPSSGTAPPRPVAAETVAAPAPPAFRSDPAQTLEVEKFVEKMRAIMGADAPEHTAALFVAIRYLVEKAVPGDLIDCNEGSTTNLAIIAAALMTFGDTSRRLIMFDVSGDASHRAESELPLWGADTSDPLDDHTARLLQHVEAKTISLPKEITATGYPSGNVSVLRYPVDTADRARAIAYLGLIADTYDSNRATMRALLPTVSGGGIIAVEGTDELRASQPGCVQHQIDAVDQYQREAGTILSFWHPTAKFRIAVNDRSTRKNDQTNAT